MPLAVTGCLPWFVYIFPHTLLPSQLGIAIRSLLIWDLFSQYVCTDPAGHIWSIVCNENDQNGPF